MRDHPVLEAQRRQRREQMRKERYAELAAISPALYERCAMTASMIAHNHHLDLAAAAEIENSLVALALDALHERS